jgi:hypothetical protein
MSCRRQASQRNPGRFMEARGLTILTLPFCADPSNPSRTTREVNSTTPGTPAEPPACSTQEEQLGFTTRSRDQHSIVVACQDGSHPTRVQELRMTLRTNK